LDGVFGVSFANSEMSSSTTTDPNRGGVLTIDKLRKAEDLCRRPRSLLKDDRLWNDWTGAIMESRHMVIIKSRDRTWRERLFSWPWRPWRRLETWTEPDPTCYLMYVSMLGGTRTVLVAHPTVAYRIRQANA